VVDAGQDENGDDVGILLGDPEATVLKVEPWLEGCLDGTIRGPERVVDVTGGTYGGDLNACLALLPVGNAFLDLALHRVGPLLGLHLTDLNVFTLGTTQVLLEVLDLRSSTVRVSKLDNRARVQEVLDDTAECTPSKLGALEHREPAPSDHQRRARSGGAFETLPNR